MKRIIALAVVAACLAGLAPTADAHTRRYRRTVVREVVYTGRPAGYYPSYYDGGYYGYAPAYGYGYAPYYGYPYGYGYGVGIAAPFLAFGFGGHHHYYGHHFGGHHH